MWCRWNERVARLLVAVSAVLAVSATGCMAQRDAVNRVQPEFIDKTQLIPNQYAALTSGTAPGSLNQATIRAEPQWLHQITILSKPPTTGFSGITSYTQVERVNFEVTEQFLVARQAYDRLHNGHCTDRAGCEGQNPRRGEIVAIYRILSHFDIRRSYNAATGEEQNIVEENFLDRPWYQRRYMRIDWSQNLLNSYTPLQFAMWQGRVRVEPTASYFNNPDDPNRPHFHYGTFNGTDNVLDYFDVTNRSVLHPEEMAIPGYSQLPVCALYDRSSESCQPADVTMRVAFRRVDHMRDYQPLFLDGHRMERFGFFEDPRTGFTLHEGGPSQLARRHLANRHNLWEQHHRPVAGLAEGRPTFDHQMGDPACQTDLDCNHLSATARCDTAARTCGEVYQRCAPSAAGTPEQRREAADRQCGTAASGSSCDTDIAYLRGDRFGLCLLPFRERNVRTVAYHLSPGYPQRIMPVTNTIVAEWNRVFSNAVREARYRECLLDTDSPNSGNPAACASWRDLATMGPHSERARQASVAWVGCHNPVWGTDANRPGFHPQAEIDAARAQGWDAPGCGEQGTSARIGDLRYSMIASVNEYDMQGPWGLAGITGDPITGEVFNGRGSVWQTVTDVQAAYATDLMRILNGEVDSAQFALRQLAADAYDYIRSQGGGREPRDPNRRVGSPRPVMREIETQTDLQNILNATAYDSANTSMANNDPNVSLDVGVADILRRAAATTIQRDDTDPRVPRGTAVTTHNDRNIMASLLHELNERTPPRESPESRRAVLRGRPIESRLLGDETILAADMNPGAPPTGETLEWASPLRRNNRQFRAMQTALRMAVEAHECAYDAQAAFSDDVISILLRRFRLNYIPPDIRFGERWDFHMAGSPERCTPEPGDPRTDTCRLNYAEIERYLQQFIHYGVMLHEIGHSVGERHNFSGSADAMNYPDRYWELRGFAGRNTGEGPVMATQIRPRWEHQANGRPFYGPAEEQNGIEEYAYSTVMDYVGFNQDSHGLGRYDQAFVYAGYVDMVEAFRDVADRDNLLNAAEAMHGGYQSGIRLTFAGNATNPSPTTYHYTDIPRLVGATNAMGDDPQQDPPAMGAAPQRMLNVPNIRDTNRFTVFLRETTRTPYNSVGWEPDHTNTATRGPNGEGGDYVVVPYRFSTDDWRNFVWNNQLYDAGADMYESMRYVSQRYLDYYFSNSFARARATFTIGGYRGRMVARYLDQIYYSMRNFLYLDRVYRDFYQAIPAFQTFLNSPTVVGSRIAGAMVLDTFVTALLMPAASVQFRGTGTHYLIERFDGTEVWDRSRNNGRRTINPQPVDIPIGIGREFASYYDYNSGFWWRENIVSAGSFHDKVLASNYLTDTFIWVPSRTVIEFNDTHNLQTNIYTAYPNQTMRFYGSLFSRDHADVGALVRPRVGQEPQLLRTQLALLNLPAGTGMNQNGRDPSLRAIDPNLGFTLETHLATDFFTQLGATFDRQAQLAARVWREGDDWAVPAATGRTFVTFTDPFTNFSYSAVHMGGATGELGFNIGLSNRDRAANETGIAARILLYANHLLNAYRTATPDTQPYRRQDLQRYIDFINIFRDLNRDLNY